MGKNRKVYEVIEELMTANGMDEKTLAEKVGVSELVIRNYLGLNKDSRNYARLKGKVKDAFGLGDDFFDEGHILAQGIKPIAKNADETTKSVKPAPKKESKKKEKEESSKDNIEKPEKPKSAKQKDVVVPNDAENTKVKKSKIVYKDSALDEGKQLVFDIKGQISEEELSKVQGEEVNYKESVKNAMKTEAVKVTSNNEAVRKGKMKQSAAPQDFLMLSIKSAGSKAKLSGKKKDITPESVEKWASEYEEELKQSVGRAFNVMKESLKANFTKDDNQPIYANKKIVELVELASKAKEDDLNLIIAMLKKITNKG